MTRHYYAAWSPYGIRVVYNEYNPPLLYTFESKQGRDSFVKRKQDREGLDPKTEAISRETFDRIKQYAHHVLESHEVTAPKMNIFNR